MEILLCPGRENGVIKVLIFPKLTYKFNMAQKGIFRKP